MIGYDNTNSDISVGFGYNGKLDIVSLCAPPLPHVYFMENEIWNTIHSILET